LYNVVSGFKYFSSCCCIVVGAAGVTICVDDVMATDAEEAPVALRVLPPIVDSRSSTPGLWLRERGLRDRERPNIFVSLYLSLSPPRELLILSLRDMS
jgi:hypothetical protein